MRSAAIAACSAIVVSLAACGSSSTKGAATTAAPSATTGLHAEPSARFVAATGYETVAERVPRREDFPGAPPEALVPGSVVFVSGK